MNSTTNTNMRKNISKAATIPIINPAFEEPAVNLKKRGGDFVESDFKFLELDVKVAGMNFEFIERGVEIVELNEGFDVEFVEGGVKIVELYVGFDVEFVKLGFEIVELDVGIDVEFAKHSVEISGLDFPSDKRAV